MSTVGDGILAHIKSERNVVYISFFMFLLLPQNSTSVTYIFGMFSEEKELQLPFMIKSSTS